MQDNEVMLYFAKRRGHAVLICSMQDNEGMQNNEVMQYYAKQ